VLGILPSSVIWLGSAGFRYNSPFEGKTPFIQGGVAMSRRFGWSLLVVAGMVLGCALGSYERTHVATAADSDDQVALLVDQLKEIKTQVKDINSLLHNGRVKVVVLINPDASR
jgi:hypothetical protein